MSLLELSHLSGHLHPGTKGNQKVLVDDIDPGTKLLDVLIVFPVVGTFLPDNQALQQGLQV